MGKRQISDVLIKAAKEILKAFREMKFYADCAAAEKQKDISAALELLEQILEKIKAAHPDGEKLYTVLYECYFSQKHYSRIMLCEKIGMETIGREITVSTLYRWQMKAVEVYAYVLWSEPRFTEQTLRYFINQDPEMNESSICEAWEIFKNRDLQ